MASNFDEWMVLLCLNVERLAPSGACLTPVEEIRSVSDHSFLLYKLENIETIDIASFHYEQKI